MKKILLASVGVLALGIGSASAADIVRPRPAPPPAPAYVAPPFTWTGAYIGINGGGAFDPSGGLVGGTLGYNYQSGPWVFGVEGDIDWADISGDFTCAGATCETRNNWLGTARARLGYAWDRFMPYVTGGAAFGGVKTSVPGFGESDDTGFGWTVGGGIEASFTPNLSAKIEYLYVDLGDTDSPVPGIENGYHTNLVRAGLNYHF
jgi:outer membrane immunogenic protein